MIIGNKFSGYSADNRRLYHLGGGGGGTTQSTGTTYQTNIPEYAEPYVHTMLGATQKQLFEMQPGEGGVQEITSFKPYKPYSTDPSAYVAPFSPMQQQAFRGAQELGPSGLGQIGGQMAGAATYGALGTQYQPGVFANQFQAPGEYRPGFFGVQGVAAPQLQQYQMGPAERAQAQSFLQPGAAEAYMSPFMESVIGKQTREAERQAGLAARQRRAQAIQQGAFGGARGAITEAAAARDLEQLKSDIYGTGQQAAFQQAQQQFNAEQQARLQAQLANQQAGLTVGGQNLAAQLGVQQLGAGQSLQAQLANQAAAQQAQAQREASRQFGYGQRMQAAGLGAQYGQAAQQLAEQSRQYGAGLGLQGLQTALQGAGTMGQLGQTQFGQQQAALSVQQQFGALQQAQEQQKINQAIQDYANMQQYPLMQLGVMSNMLRGLPMQAATTNQYVAAPNPITQGIGLAGAGASIYNALKAEGGVIKEMAEGGIASVPRYDVGGEIESKLESMDTDDLQRQLRESSSPAVRRMAQRILRERQMEGGADRSAPPVGPMGIDYQAPSMAGGGIVAFQEGGMPPVANQSGLIESYRTATGILNDPARFKRFADADPEAANRLADYARRLGSQINTSGPSAEMRAGEEEARLVRPSVPLERVDSGTTTAAAPQAAPAGITQAAPAPVERRAAVPSGAATAEGAAGEAEAQAARAAGITTVQPSPAFRGVTSDIQKAAYEAQTRADRPISAFLSEIEAGKPENAAVAEYRQRIMAERANSKQEAERQRYMRAAQFFARWGSTPGPTLAAGLKAFEQTIPELVADEKEQKKVMRELDKVQFDIDNSIRLEKLGDMKEARAQKEKAADRAMQLNERVAQMQTSIETSETSAAATRYSADKSLEAARARERGAALDRGEARKSRESQQNETQFRVARDQLERVISGISREKESKSYTDDMRTLETARMMAKDDQGNFDESKLSPAYKDKYNAAKTRLEERNRDFETRRRNAEAIVDRAAAKVGVEGVSAAMSSEDQEALRWANDPANKNDPRAAQIKARLGVR